ncbi:MAG: hypothetical protein R3C16_03405 [Hyphomonadaceae bacterium]
MSGEPDQKPPAPGTVIDALLREAERGGADALKAARQAAALAESFAPTRTRAALQLAARLDPLDARIRLALARLDAEDGDLAAAHKAAEAVLADAVDQGARARAAFILGELARVEGDRPAARGHYETAQRIEDKLLSATPNDATAARWYARARGRLAELDAHAGDLSRARTGAEGALALLRASAAQVGEQPVLAADIADAEMRLAALELDFNEPASARRRLAEAIGRYEALAITETDEPHWRAVLSDAWALAAEADYLRGAPAEARAAIDKALQARIKLATQRADERWALAGTWRVRAALLAALDDNKGAADSLEQARILAERIAGSEATLRFLVHTLLDQADHALRSGALETARRAAEDARTRAEAIAQLKDAPPDWFGETGACWDRLGEAARLAQDVRAALDAFSRAAEFRRLACEAAPSNARFVRGLAAALLKLGDAALAAGQNESARAALMESARHRLELFEAAPQDLRAAMALAAALERLGLAATAMGDVSAARAAWEDELALADRIFAEDDLEGLRFRAIVESHLVGLSGVDAEHYRAAALQRFDVLAKAGALSEREAALRKRLWGG